MQKKKNLKCPKKVYSRFSFVLLQINFVQMVQSYFEKLASFCNAAMILSLGKHKVVNTVLPKVIKYKVALFISKLQEGQTLLARHCRYDLRTKSFKCY